MALSGAELPTRVARQYIASAIHLLVHIARLSSGERKIMRISELSGFADGQYAIDDIFICRLSGFADDGTAHANFYATGHEPHVLQRLAGLGFFVPDGLFTARELDIQTAQGDS